MNNFELKNIVGEFIENFNNLEDSASDGEIKNIIENFINKYNNLSENIKINDITEHTANMWKYIPVPEDEPEPFPEYKTINLKLPECNIIASRVRGKKHKHEGTNCDDWFEISNYGRIACFAVSDGAGSKKLSRIGAKISCMTAVSAMKKSLEKLFTENTEIYDKIKLNVNDPQFLEICKRLAEIVQEAVLNSIEAVEIAFQSRSLIKAYSDFLERQPLLNDFSSTLLTALAIPIDAETSECLVISCQIGDGMIALLNSRENSVKLMGIPDSGDFSGETEFLTSPEMKNMGNLQSRTRITKTVADYLFMMTDGVADDYFPNDSQMLRLYSDLILNGIIPNNIAESDNKFSQKIPEPVGYPCINDKSKKVFLRYTNKICESLDLPLDEFCKNKAAVSLARIPEEETEKTSPEELLQIWLDNYVERGSFDDRTLIIAKFGG